MSQAKIESSTEQQWVTYKIKNTHYAAPVGCIREILPYMDITPALGTPPHVLGFINLRGQAVTVMDTEQRYSDNKTSLEKMYIMVLEGEQSPVGIIVDKVDKVINIHKDAIDNLPEIGVHDTAGYIDGLFRQDETLYVLINAEQMLDKLCKHDKDNNQAA